MRIATAEQFGYIPVSEWNSYYPYPKVGALRQMIYRNTDGFYDEVVRTIGKRLYISVSDFHDWIEKTNNNKKAS